MKLWKRYKQICNKYLIKQIDSIKQQHEIEKKELLAELDQLTASFENLEKDNNSLRDQLNVYCESGTGFTSMIQKWEEEKAELKRQNK